MCVDKRYMDNYDVLFLDIENPPGFLLMIIHLDVYHLFPYYIGKYPIFRYTHVLFIWMMMMMMMMISTAQVVLSVKCGR